MPGTALTASGAASAPSYSSYSLPGPGAEEAARAQELRRRRARGMNVEDVLGEVREAAAALTVSIRELHMRNESLIAALADNDEDDPEEEPDLDDDSYYD